ncbi:hypothetical protein FGKAn22_12340 [Ferrigenium kumadai]|uniref:Uncharacterized protein n=1 Tax=Ferrigenium kumadai TaxID=1682490 RepID=A0AAN1SZK2_9PROT|nr:cellulose synthase subunit BcsC-related outer membrane protein [Ferrigenium kumadai]BBI99541.1 hypothetical protein FGKAn22_12340 [Ferrigenium kumadai]
MKMRKRLSPLALGLILNAACLPAHAQTGEAPAVTAKAFRISGSRAFTETELLKLVEHSVGRKLSRSELIELADGITAYYRRHGFPRAHAIIPPQNFSDGVVRFLVTTAPASTAPDSLQAPSPLIKATGFRIVGSRAFTEAQLLTLVTDVVGKELTPSDLDALAQRITGFYRERGFRRARAVVRPGIFERTASQVVEGIVRFLITTLPVGESVHPDQADVSSQPQDHYVYVPSSDDPLQELLERAKWWEARDRIDLAQESLDKLFSIAPGHPSGLAMQAQIEIRRNQPKEAQGFLDKLRRSQPDHPAIPRIEALLRTFGQDKAELRHARSLVKASRYQEAAAIFRKLYPDGPPSDDLTLEYWQMVANTPRGWYPAREGIAKLVKNNPYNLHYRLTLAEHETSRLPLKRQALAVIIDMTRVPAFSQQARDAWRSAMRRLGDNPSSLPLLRQYLATEPNDSAIREKQTQIVAAQERQRRLMADPNYRAGVEGIAFLEKGELDTAEPLLEQALRARPTDSELTGGMGTLRLRQGRHAEARQYFAQAERLTPGGSKRWNSMGKVAQFWQLMREAREARKNRDFALAENRLYAALQVEHNEPNAVAALADILADRGLFEAAANTYRRALSVEPLNTGALEGLIALYRRQGQEREVQQVIAQLSPAQRKVLSATLNRMNAAVLKEQADRLLAHGQEDESIQLLEQAVRLDADDPWSRFALARLYARHNHPEQGQALFDDLLARHPDDSEALYALGEYQSSQGRSVQVLTTLARIPVAKRSTKTSHLRDRNLRQIANTYMQPKHRDEAARLLREAEVLAADDEEAGLAVALAWGRIGEYPQADRVFDALRSALPSIRWRLRHAEYLAMKNAPELAAELDSLAALQLNPDEKQELYALQESFTIRTANGYLASNQPGLAHQTLAPFLKNAPDRIPLLLAEAQAYWAEEQWPSAQSTFAHVLRLEADEPAARRGLIETQLAAGDRAAALAQLAAWAASSTSLSSRLQLVDLYLTLDEPEHAREQLDTLLAQYPNHPGVLNQAWQLAQHERRLDDEIVYLQKSLAAEYAERTPPQAVTRAQGAPVAYEHIGFDELGAPEKIQRDWKEKKLAALVDRRTDWLSSAVDISSRSGTPGLSQYRSIEIPMEYKTPWHADDEVFFRADLVKLDAGSVDPANTNFGSQLLCQPLCTSSLAAQTTQGMAFAAGYHSDELRADIGITPLNFAVSNVVGGIRHDGDIGQFSYSIEASRRPLTGSVLSFAGTRDPRTGLTWGGTVATGGRLGLSLDKGEALGFWSSLGLYSLTGRNVSTNNRLQLMAGEQWRIVNEENRLFSLGLTGMYWHHTRNAGEYTFGHGGYYSPQNYRSLSLPVTYGERYPRFSWMLRAAASVSQSQTQAADYYPTDPAMQAQAVALAPTTFVTPVYTGGPSSGRGYSLRGAWEYQVDRQLFAGGLLAIERSQYYAPNRAMLYLRYSLDQPAAQPVYFPPLPVEPSSQF